MNAIDISHITKDYGSHKGIFDVSLSVKKGEVYGFLGPNGAGKTTTSKLMNGLLKPTAGTVLVEGVPTTDLKTSAVARKVGYLAGEIAFPEDCTGDGLLRLLAEMKGIKDKSRMRELMELLELDPSGRVRKMSKGMKQKLGIVNAFMGNPEIVILDEPTSGLDPLMQNRFIELILEEKKKGTTVFMSSHLFEEVERTCERTAIIRQGEIAAIEDMEGLKKKRTRDYIITLDSKEAADALVLPGFSITRREGCQVTVAVKGDIPRLLSLLSECSVRDLQIHTQTLEEIFLHYYGGEKA